MGKLKFVFPTPSKEVLFFNGEAFLEFAEQNYDRYVNADPFPHIVIEDFIDEELASRVLDEFLTLNEMNLEIYGKTVHLKGHSSDDEQWGCTTRQLMYAFNSAPFLKGLEKLTGVHGLIPDPYFQGGGLHQIGDGGYLKVHADYNFHKRTQLDRRLNLLLYLNKDWPDEFGGALELWDQEMTRCVVKVPPRYNTCVIFSTTSYSHHGHPGPLRCGDRTRKSLALYYYSNGRPEEEANPAHTTLYRERPSETFKSLKQKKGVSVMKEVGAGEKDAMKELKELKKLKKLKKSKKFRPELPKTSGRGKFDISSFNATDELRVTEPLIRYEPDPARREELPHKRDKLDPLVVWQFEFLKQVGLKPRHRLLEIGPGGFRVAQHLVGYLDPGHYHAVEVSRNALHQGWQLLNDEERARNPRLYWGGDFSFHHIGAAFDFAWAHSVFTHLAWNHIGRCLFELRRCIANGGAFYATYFAVDRDPWEPHTYGRVIEGKKSRMTYGDRDPYHYCFETICALARDTGWRGEHIALPEHPKGQSMLKFTPAG